MSASTYLAYDFPLLSAFWTMLWFFLWIMWFVLLFRIVVDIFRDDAMSGWAKTGWLVFVIVLPFLGVFVYVIARGKNMGHREISQDGAAAGLRLVHPRHRQGRRKVQQRRRTRQALRDPRTEVRRAKDLVLTGHGPATHSGADAASHGR